MPIIENSSYRAKGIARNPHVSTLRANAFRAVPKMGYVRERIPTEDGDFLDLDWIRSGNEKALVLSHGLAGDSSRVYMRGMAKYFHDREWDICAWNFRGCSGEPNLTEAYYHPAQVGDLGAVVDRVLAGSRYAQVALVGFSMGGVLTLNYLARAKSELPRELLGACCISTPCDMYSTVGRLSNRPGKIYGKIFLSQFKKRMREKEKAMPGTYDLDKLKTVRTLYDFDRVYNAPWYGYADIGEFYEYMDPRPFLDRVEIPSLVVNARNDPFMDDGSYPKDVAARSKYIHLEIPDHGGHMGFGKSGLKDGNWAEARAHDFLSALLA